MLWLRTKTQSKIQRIMQKHSMKHKDNIRPKRGSNKPRYLEDYVAKWHWAGNTFQKQNPPIFQSWLLLDDVPLGFAISKFLQGK